MILKTGQRNSIFLTESASTNTVGALPGVIGVPLTGYLLEMTDNWELSMFLPAVFFYVTGVGVFTKWGRAEKQSWG